MTKVQKLALGIATLPPAVYFPLFFLSPLRNTFSVDITSPQVPDWVLLFASLHFLMFLYTGLLWAFYMINVFGSRELSRDAKLLWATLLVLFSVFAMPVYWYLNIWKGR